MKQIVEPLPRSTKAFGLFVDEVCAHVQRAVELLANPESAAGAWAELKDGFHRAKGGAGFFALPEVAGLSAALEELCAAPGGAARKAEAARPLLERLTAELAGLRKSD